MVWIYICLLGTDFLINHHHFQSVVKNTKSKRRIKRNEEIGFPTDVNKFILFVSQVDFKSNGFLDS